MSDQGKKAREELTRVRAPVEVALLDDINRGILRVAERLEAQVPQGIKDEAAFSVSGTNPVPIQPPRTRPPYMKASIFNDGPSPIYVFLNDITPISMRQAPLNQGDRADLDTVEAKIQSIFVACTTAAGQASGRVWLMK